MKEKEWRRKIKKDEGLIKQNLMGPFLTGLCLRFVVKLFG